MLSDAITEDWTAIGRGRVVSGTDVRGQVGIVVSGGHTAISAALDDEQASAAFQAAIGTVSPTPWISPSMYEVALEHFAPLRRDPEFVDPDIIAVISDGHRQLIEIKWRTWTEEIVRQVSDVIGVVINVADHSYRPKRQWTRFIETGDVVAFGSIVAETDVIVGTPTHQNELAATIETITPAPVELPESALIAREIRDVSGLTTRQLGAVFPVARENFQRWTTGTPPNEANLERLLALQHFFRALADRVDDAKVWMFSPLDDAADSPTPYALLRRGDLTTPWDALSQLPSRTPYETVYDSEGNRGVRIIGSTQGPSVSTPEEELDDYSEWLDEE